MSTGASRSLSLIGLCLVTSFGLACQTPPERFEFTEVHMGLPVRLVLHARGESAARDAARAGFARIRGLDAIMSDYRPDSELSRLGRTSGRPVAVSRELFAVLSRARELAEVTDGAFDPTIGPLTTLWRIAREDGRLPDAGTLERARNQVGWHLLELDRTQLTAALTVEGMSLNLGGIAKGFILDEALSTLRSLGFDRVLIEAGGDVVVGEAPPGTPGWHVEVAGADDVFTARAAALTHAALATSGASVQFIEIDGVRYSHVIDPATGLGLTHNRMVHVIAPDGATADALATAVGVMADDRIDDLQAVFPDVAVSIPDAGR
jgi:thiamine biosynthesis lipoprotein